MAFGDLDGLLIKLLLPSNSGHCLLSIPVQLALINKVLNTLERHANGVILRWLSVLTIAWLEGMNSLF